MHPLFNEEPIRFDCLKCGRCCHMLINENNGIQKGLELTKDEVKMFPAKMVSPSFGRGKTLDSIYVITRYQLNVEKCPFIKKDNTCKIYEKRPISCRRFPLMFSSDAHICNIAIGINCKFIEKIEEHLGYELNYLFTPEKFIAKKCWQALETEIRLKENSYIDAKLDNMDIFSYDLKTNKWFET